MSQFAQLVKNGLQLNALKLDRVDPMIAARNEKMAQIVSANGLRTDSLPSNGIHYINALGLKVDDSDTDPMIAARNEKMAQIVSANK